MEGSSNMISILRRVDSNVYRHLIGLDLFRITFQSAQVSQMGSKNGYLFLNVRETGITSYQCLVSLSLLLAHLICLPSHL